MSRADNLIDSSSDYLQSFSIRSLFEDLTTSLIVERPKDPLVFIIDKIKAKQVARKSPDRPRIVFVVGGPGSGKSSQCAQLSEQCGCLHLNVPELIRAEAAASPLLKPAALALAERPGLAGEALIRACPTETIVQFLRSKLLAADGSPLASTATTVMEGFPLTLRDAFAFERAVCEVHSILFLDVPDRVFVDRTARRGDSPADVAARLEVWQQRSRALPEYYGTLEKVCTYRVPRVPCPPYTTTSITTRTTTAGPPHRCQWSHGRRVVPDCPHLLVERRALPCCHVFTYVYVMFDTASYAWREHGWMGPCSVLWPRYGALGTAWEGNRRGGRGPHATRGCAAAYVSLCSMYHIHTQRLDSVREP